MVGIDKAAIVFSMAITIIGVGIAFAGAIGDSSMVILTSPRISTSTVSTEALESRVETDTFADLAQKVREENEKKTIMEEFSKEDDVGSQTHIVKIPVETSSPGCEETNACYLPTSITINVGDTIKWINLDIATHTASSGSLSEGPTSVFESSLIRNNASFTFTFEETGIYDYYCMLHPWMIGSVSVS